MPRSKSSTSIHVQERSPQTWTRWGRTIRQILAGKFEYSDTEMRRLGNTTETKEENDDGLEDEQKQEDQA
ncbi:hypothetical protein M430DRAFT_18336 [Amorphotheca resinae ATCC 22711]|uniref:Uncharacterized protein n=1 Tax=Amorphotheca resinae ATCC 22711 TaxID=857342 RepID=A0A2T3B3D6_AMORE|nr:hypothetical protein M430DRAFT_18336 [Amorphotheca resinae ATCC 22711]PSS20164.1 hypothetical protein M430DRAFT_18336 [Amorphotheca resinae ATCC 22711]